MMELTRVMAVAIFCFLFILMQIIYFFVKNRKTLRKIISTSFYTDKDFYNSPQKPKEKKHYGERQMRELAASIAFAAIFFAAGIIVIGNIFGALICASVALGLVYAVQNIQKIRYTEIFSRNLADALILGANAMRAGASLTQAINHIAVNAMYPVNLEFSKVDRAIKLGMPVDEAMRIIRDNVTSKEVDILITAVHVLLRTGGNMTEVFDNIAGVIKERIMFKNTIRATTAQTRLSAAAISIMLFFIVFVVNYMSPGYFSPLIKRYGAGVFILAFWMMGTGWLIIRKLLNIETD